jgi:hypothetical protein
MTRSAERPALVDCLFHFICIASAKTAWRLLGGNHSFNRRFLHHLQILAHHTIQFILRFLQLQGLILKNYIGYIFTGSFRHIG